MPFAPGVRRWFGCLMLTLPACSLDTPRPVDTGSRQTAVGFYEALFEHNWRRAYDVLDADSRAKCSGEQFARWAANYLQRLGFEPRAVRVQACEEQGTRAVAHLVLTGHDAKKHRRFREGVELRRDAERWHVVLPSALSRNKLH